MGKIPILNARKEWACPNCGAADVTNEARPHTRMHTCAGLGGLTAPLVERKALVAKGAPGETPVRVSTVVREDYVGDEKGLTYDQEGRPVMAVVTEYADGSNDVAMYAPVVRVEMRQ